MFNLLHKSRYLLLRPNYAFGVFLALCVFPIALFIGALLSLPYDPEKIAKTVKLYLPFWQVAVLWSMVAIAIATILTAAYSRGFLDKVKFWVQHIVQPLSLGAALGLLFAACYLYLVSVGTVDVSSDTVMVSSLGIYLAVSGLFVGFYGVYHEQLPLMDIRTLMDRLTEDLERCDTRLFWCYPGLSFGSVTVAGPQYDRFYEVLSSKLKDRRHERISKEFILLSFTELERFYEPYRSRARSKGNDGLIHRIDDLALKHSRELLQTIALKVELSKEQTEKVVCDYSPPEFRLQLIVIDDIAYLLNPIGLPIYQSKRWIFTLEADAEGATPVEFVAVRIKNGFLANQLARLARAELEVIRRNKGGDNEAN